MISIASLFVLLVVVVPILGRKWYVSDYIIKSNPTMENTNLWAKIPGDLRSVHKHNFIFFDYDRNNTINKTIIKMYKNITLDENITYSQFQQGEGKTIFFYNNRTFSTKDDLNVSSSMDNINLGMFEALETMAYPPLYKLGINSIYYLTQKYFLEDDLFIKELFTYNIIKQLTPDDYKNQILKGIPDYIQSKILDDTNEPYKTYSLKTNPGFFEWIKILGSNEKVKAATWLTDIFNLDETQKNSILISDNSYLIEEYKKYKKNIVTKFDCKDESKCAEELLYKQLINSSVISATTELESYKKLNDFLGLDIYPFDKSPELNNFDFYDSLTMDQLKQFIDKNSESCLLYLENSIQFLNINKTGDAKQTYYTDLTYSHINFLTGYFYKSLPNVFLYPYLNMAEDDKKDGPISYGLLSKAVSNFLPEVSASTYDKISKIKLLEHLDKKIPYARLKEELKVETEKICSTIYKEVLGENPKIDEICSESSLDLKTEDSFYNYYQFYYCQNDTMDKSRCNNEIENTLKEKGLTDENIQSLISKQSRIGKNIDNYNKELADKYKCSGQCTNEYLLRIQFAKATVTRSFILPLEYADGLKGWFTELKDDYEIINILEKNNADFDFDEKDAFWIIDTKVTKGDILDLDNSKMFKNKINFEKEYMRGLINKKTEEYSSLVKLTNFLFGLFVFGNTNNELIVDYKSVDEFLQGECSKTSYWVNKIKNGNYYENFNPKIEKLTKFDFGFNFDNGTQNDVEFDHIGISTDTESDLAFAKRGFIMMNDLFTLNIKKTEYSSKNDSLIKLNMPLFNFEKLFDEYKFYSDGYQYDHRLDVIYYFDYISSRSLVFVKDAAYEEYKGRIECKKYVLNENDYTSQINEIFDKSSDILYMTQKTHKPIMLDPTKDNLLKFGYDPGKKLENYICVDPVSDMVIDSKLNFVYSINSRKYGLLNKNIELDAKYPLFLYSKTYEVDLDSYEEQYEGAADYYDTNFAFLIIGVLIVIFFSTFALVAFNIVHKRDKEDKQDLTEVIGDELGEGTEKLKSDADPDNENNTDDNEIERLRVQNEIENADNNENENNN